MQKIGMNETHILQIREDSDSKEAAMTNQMTTVKSQILNW